MIRLVQNDPAEGVVGVTVESAPSPGNSACSRARRSYDLQIVIGLTLSRRMVRTVPAETGSDLRTPGAAVARCNRLRARQRRLWVNAGQPFEHLREASSEPEKENLRKID